MAIFKMQKCSFELRYFARLIIFVSYSEQGKSLGTMPPHVFAIADKVVNLMKRFLSSCLAKK